MTEQGRKRKTRSIKVYKKWDVTRRVLETEIGGGRLSVRPSTSSGINGDGSN